VAEAWQSSEEGVCAVEWVTVLIGWGEKLLGVRSEQNKAATRIADGAVQLRRQLAASFEDWPDEGPRTLEELVRWAFNFADGRTATELELRRLLDLSADASDKVRKPVATARDEYYAIANVINQLAIPSIKQPWNTTEAVAAEPQLRRAWAHMRPCLVALGLACEE
jgi:hypothetical protein